MIIPIPKDSDNASRARARARLLTERRERARFNSIEQRHFSCKRKRIDPADYSPRGVIFVRNYRRIYRTRDYAQITRFALPVPAGKALARRRIAVPANF